MKRKKNIKTFILHGWTYNLDKWKPFLSVLKSKGFNPILLKIPGLTSKIDHPWTIDNYIDLLFEKLKDEKKVNLIGHSNGGRIAMAFALKYQDKVENLILIDSAGIYHDDILIRLKRTVFGFLAKSGRKFLSSSEKAREILYFFTRERDYRDASKIMRKTMSNLLEADKSLEPEKIINPTLIIWGRNDRITPLSDAYKLKKLIVNSKLLIVNGARHAPHFTHPEKVSEIIIENT
jgi:non-heme chloroperoxidase